MSTYGGTRTVSTPSIGGSTANSSASSSSHWGELCWWNRHAQQHAKAFQSYRLRDRSISALIGMHVIGTVTYLGLLQLLSTLNLEEFVESNGRVYSMTECAASASQSLTNSQIFQLRFWQQVITLCLFFGICTGWVVVFGRLLAQRIIQPFAKSDQRSQVRFDHDASTVNSYEGDEDYLLQPDKLNMQEEKGNSTIKLSTLSLSSNPYVRKNGTNLMKQENVNYRLAYRFTRFLSANSTIKSLEVLHFYTVLITNSMFCAYLVGVSQFMQPLSLSVPAVPKQGLLPEGLVTGLSITPLLFYMVLSSITFGHALLGLTVVMGASAILCCSYGLWESFPLLVINVTFGIGMIAEYHRQCWTAYSIKQKLIQVNRDNASLAEEVKAAELRHAIGNVVHDLKTPLTSFISGMEVVAMVGKELQLDLHHVANNTIKEKIDMIIDVADNVTSTNAFLIMTINRCVDYTKSTFGITLQPKLEPFRIRDIVNFVVNCCIHSNEMTERFHIGIEEDSSDRRRTESTGHQENISQLSHPATLSPNSISSLIAVNYAHPGLLDGSVTIYSDRQWIQENLLCMLTNALRYSEHREAVSINVSVVSSAVSAASSVSSTSSAFGSSVDDLKSTSANKSCNSEVTELIIRVYDDGEMLDEDQRERIFQEPIQSSRITGGVGVGLYTIALRVSALGGRYGIEEVTQNAEKHADASSEASNSQILGRKYFWFSIPFNFCGQSNPGSAVQRQVTEDLATMRSLTSTVTNSVIAPALTQESKLQEPIITQEAHHAINTTTLENTEIEPEDKETKKVPLHILVVDDSPLVVKMTSLALKKQGFQVSVADNGKTAIDKFKRSLEKKNKQPSDLQHDPSVHYEKDVIDIILMDFQMPVMDGIEAIRQVRLIESEFYGISSASKHVTENPVFIIGFSAKSDDDQVQVAYECGMNAFLSKPFTLTAFQSILSQI